MDVLPFELPDLETEWAAYNERSLVSHAGRFMPTRNPTIAFTPPRRPMHALRVALVSTGGVHLATQEAFDMASHSGDDSLRWIPGDVDSSTLCFAHDHYDHTDCDADPNCMFPIDRLHELAHDGVIGSVARSHAGCMGFIPNPARFLAETVPQIIARFIDDHIDAAIFSPG